MITNLPVYVYKFRCFNEYWEDIFKNNQLYMPLASELNDPFEGKLIPMNTGDAGNTIRLMEGGCNKNAENVLSKYRILSLAKNIRSKSMWAYYAYNYSGFALEFNTKYTFSSLKQVVYKSGKFNTELRNTLNEIRIGIENALLYKSKDWSHEEEYRLINNRIDIKYKKFGRDDINSIILGYSISLDNEKKLIEFAKKLGTNIKRMYLAPYDDTIEFYYDKDKCPARGDGSSYRKYIIKDM